METLAILSGRLSSDKPNSGGLHKMLTQSRLKEYLHYDPETGLFTWIKNTRNTNHVGNLTSQKPMANGYLTVLIFRKKYLLHRLAWLYVYGEIPENEIDHINGIKTDNRISNLRHVTHQQNLKNMPIDKRNKTGVTGVYYRGNNTWQSCIGVNKKVISLGYYKNIFDAACARKSAEKTYGFHENHGRAKQ